MIDKLAMAYDYLDHGYNVIPTDRQARVPLIPWSEYQTRKTTHEELEKWFENPTTNLAIVYGSISGAVCIDADSEDAIKWVYLTLPYTPFRVRTRKGCHFIYKHPGTPIQSVTKIKDIPPIDVKADGGIATGISSTRGGFVYHLADNDADLKCAVDLPTYNPDWLGTSGIPRYSMPFIPTGDAIENGEKYLSKVPNIEHGERNAAIYRLAKTMKDKINANQYETTELLSRFNLDCVVPPLEASELRVIINSAFKGEL